MAATHADAGPLASAWVAATTAEPKVSFGLVAFGEPKFQRLTSGTLVAVLPANDYAPLHVLSPDGAITAVDNVQRALAGRRGTTGAVSGDWPGTLYVELFLLGGRGGTPTSTTLVVRGDEQRASVTGVIAASHYSPSFPWRDGASLALRVAGPSRAFGGAVEAGGSLVVLPPSKVSPPRFPKDALVEGALVAYPSGRVLALGGKRSRPVSDGASEYEYEHNYMLDRAMVWQSDAASAGMRAVQLPGTTPRMHLRGGLAKGPTESHTLAWGILDKRGAGDDEPYLARFGADGWKRVSLPSGSRSLVDLDVGEDGIIWAVASNAYDLSDAALLRGTFGPTEGVAFEPVDIPYSSRWTALGRDGESLSTCDTVRPRSVIARDAADVWIVANCVAQAKGAPERYPPFTAIVLHTQREDRLSPFRGVDIASK